jgi:hypothetical protein
MLNTNALQEPARPHPSFRNGGRRSSALGVSVPLVRVTVIEPVPAHTVVHIQQAGRDPLSSIADGLASTSPCGDCAVNRTSIPSA